MRYKQIDPKLVERKLRNAKPRIKEIALHGRIPFGTLCELLSYHVPNPDHDFEFLFLGRGRSGSELFLVAQARLRVAKCGPWTEICKELENLPFVEELDRRIRPSDFHDSPRIDTYGSLSCSFATDSEAAITLKDALLDSRFNVLHIDAVFDEIITRMFQWGGRPRIHNPPFSKFPWDEQNREEIVRRLQRQTNKTSSLIDIVTETYEFPMENTTRTFRGRCHGDLNLQNIVLGLTRQRGLHGKNELTSCVIDFTWLTDGQFSPALDWARVERDIKLEILRNCSGPQYRRLLSLLNAALPNAGFEYHGDPLDSVVKCVVAIKRVRTAYFKQFPEEPVEATAAVVDYLYHSLCWNLAYLDTDEFRAGEPDAQDAIIESALSVYDRLVEILENLLQPAGFPTRALQRGLSPTSNPPTDHTEQVQTSTASDSFIVGDAIFSSRRLLQNLPQPAYSEFINRDEEVATILARLFHPIGCLIAIEGIGGIGKTALALRVAHEVTLQSSGSPERVGSFDAVIWASAKHLRLTSLGARSRHGALQSLNDLYRMIASTLGMRDILRHPRDEQREILLDVFARKRCLLVVDNLESADDDVFSFLQEIPVPSRAIATTRMHVDGTEVIELSPLSCTLAKTLIRSELRRTSIGIREDEIERITTATEGLPLAIVWSVAQVASGVSIGVAVGELRRHESDVLRFCFENSVKALSGRPEHEMLMAISFFNSDVGRSTLGLALDVDDLSRDRSLSQLKRLSLIYIVADRIDMHPAARRFARGLLATNEQTAARVQRNLIRKIGDMTRAQFDRDYWAPIRRWLEANWLDPEISNIFEIVAAAADTGASPEFVLYVGGGLVHHLWRLGRGEDRLSVCTWALRAAAEVSNPTWNTWLLIDGMGYVFLSRREWDSAKAVIERGLALASEQMLPDAEALGMAYLALVHAEKGQTAEADYLLKQASSLTTTPTIVGRAKAIEARLALNGQLWAVAEGALQEAIEYRRKSDGYTPPTQLALLGLVQAYQKNYEVARKTIAESLQHQRNTMEAIGYASFGLALIKIADRDWVAAKAMCERALAIASQLKLSGYMNDIDKCLARISTQKMD